MGYNIGVRLIEDFLSKSRQTRCKTMTETAEVLKDAFRQYIAYHEGWGNFKYYKKNKKVINLAKKVEKQSYIYKKQLSKCKNSLNKNKYIIF